MTTRLLTIVLGLSIGACGGGRTSAPAAAKWRFAVIPKALGVFGSVMSWPASTASTT